MHTRGGVGHRATSLDPQHLALRHFCRTDDLATQTFYTQKYSIHKYTLLLLNRFQRVLVPVAGENGAESFQMTLEAK